MPFDWGMLKELAADCDDDSEIRAVSSLDEDVEGMHISDAEVIYREDGTRLLIVRFNDEKLTGDEE